MAKEDKVQNIYYCKQCDITSVVTNEWNSCGFCGGDIKDIGWVEES